MAALVVERADDRVRDHSDQRATLIPAASRVGELRPSAAISSGAATIAPSSSVAVTRRAGAIDVDRAALHAQIDAAGRGRRLEDRAPQQAIFVHRAKRIVVRIGDEIELARREPVADADVPDGAALAPRAAHRCRSHRASAPLALATAEARPSKPLASVDRRIGRIDDDRSEAMRIEREGERAADQPAAEDENVCLGHTPV